MSGTSGKAFSDLELVQAFTVEGLANARVSAAKVEMARIADQPVAWKLGEMAGSGAEELLAKYMPDTGAGGDRPPAGGLRLVAPLGWLPGKDPLGGIVGLPGYQAAANIPAQAAAFKSFTIDPSSFALRNYLSPGKAPAFSWPISLDASEELALSLGDSHAVQRGFVGFEPAAGRDGPSVFADIVEFNGDGLTGSYLALRFLRAGATASHLPPKLSYADLDRTQPLVLLPLDHRAPQEVLTDFVYELAHNSPIDVAAWDAVRDHDFQTRRPPVVLAPRTFLDRARLSDTIPGLMSRLRRLAPGTMPGVSRADLWRFNYLIFKDLILSSPTIKSVQDVLAKNSEFNWLHESDSAESLLVVSRSLDAAESLVSSRSEGPSSPRASTGFDLKSVLGPYREQRGALGGLLTSRLPDLGGISDMLGSMFRTAKRVQDAIAPADETSPQAASDESIVPASAGPPQRFTNVKIFDDRQELKRDKSLVAAKSYFLDVSIGTEREGVTANDEDQPKVGIAGQSAPANVWVVLTDETDPRSDPAKSAFTFNKRYGSLTLPVVGKSEDSARFKVTPNPATFAADGRGRLGIRLYHKLNLIDHIELDIHVAASEPIVPGDGRPAIGVTFCRPSDDDGIETPDEANAARAISISITRASAGDLYRLAFVSAKDQSGEPQLIATKTLSETALNDFVSRFREILLKMVFGASLTNARISADQRDDLLKDLSVLGTDVVTKLFDYEAAEGDVFAIGQMVSEALPDASIIQIALTGGAENLVFPWQILTLEPYADVNQPVSAQNLWGYRFLIEVKRLRDGADDRPIPLRMRRPARVCYARWQQFYNEAAHYGFLQEAIGKTGGNVELEPAVIEGRSALIDALARGGGDLLYVYAHGHAAAPNTPAGHAFNNNIRQQIQAIAENPALAMSPEQVVTYKLMLTTTDNTSISSLSLTNSNVLLTNLITAQNAGIRLHDGPIVFLNTCQSAQLWNAIESSFVGFFLKRGARAVLGTESTIPVVVADLFGRAVLTEMFAGKSLGEAVKMARDTLLAEQNNPLGLCYSIYGAADARLFSKPPTSQGELA